MVENSREGRTTANSNIIWNQFSPHPVGARGYYYTWVARHYACPEGWSVPSLAEFQGLAATVNAMPNDNISPRRFWSQNLAGSRNAQGKWNNWGTWGNWWTDDPVSASQAQGATKSATGISNPVEQTNLWVANI